MAVKCLVRRFRVFGNQDTIKARFFLQNSSASMLTFTFYHFDS